MPDNIGSPLPLFEILVGGKISPFRNPQSVAQPSSPLTPKTYRLPFFHFHGKIPQDHIVGVRHAPSLNHHVPAHPIPLYYHHCNQPML